MAASPELSCSIIGAAKELASVPSVEVKLGRPRICSRKSSAGVSEGWFAMTRPSSENESRNLIGFCSGVAQCREIDNNSNDDDDDDDDGLHEEKKRIFNFASLCFGVCLMFALLFFFLLLRLVTSDHSRVESQARGVKIPLRFLVKGTIFFDNLQLHPSFCLF